MSVPAPRPDLGNALNVLLQEIGAASDEVHSLLSSCQRCRNRVLYLLDTPADQVAHRTRISARLAALRANHDVHRRGSQHVTGQDRGEPVIRGVTVPCPAGERDAYLALLDGHIRGVARQEWHDAKARKAVLDGLLAARALYLGQLPGSAPRDAMLSQALSGSLLDESEPLPLSDAGAESEAAADAAERRAEFSNRDGVL